MFRQKVFDAIFFENVKMKIIHDKRYKSLLFKKKIKSISNCITNINQRCGSFLMKQKIDRLAYELKLLLKWKIHSVILVSQLESVNDEDFYHKYRSHYSEAVENKKNIKFEKSYEIKKMINKRIRKFGKTEVTQYLFRWLSYDSEYDEWKSLTAFEDCMNLIHDFEKRLIAEQFIETSANDNTKQNHENKSDEKFDVSSKKKKERFRKLSENNWFEILMMN